MAESIDLERRAAVRLAGRGAGLRPEQARLLQGQQYAVFREADILTLPSVPDSGGLQVIDGTTLSFRFMLGLSRLGGPDTL